ncbi:protein of unknown function [Mesotoga infera]|uniref:Uncharacterized protein n=1 Tax=Mesotoga infera TaxID=1236046 RepID=A0A7Z7LDT7_9BACT|nr:protein of unknown function [Mesotoga infera]
MSRVRGPYARFCERTRGSAPLLLDCPERERKSSYSFRRYASRFGGTESEMMPLLIEKPEEEQRDNVLEPDFDAVTQYESI